jgi:hypothetical protein
LPKAASLHSVQRTETAVSHSRVLPASETGEQCKMIDIVLSDAEAKSQECRCVVRLRRTGWHDAKGIHQRIDLTYLKRHCRNFNILDEDAYNIGADQVLPRITNLNECDDGVYEVWPCNEKQDWETGYVDDYDYRLTPYISGGTKP